MQDDIAYELYPHHRKWFNKLWFSNQMSYICGPGGVPTRTSGWYIVRPIMNIRGMGLGSRKMYIESNDTTVVGPGEFWCEWFNGVQYSVDFVRSENKWVQSKCYRAERDINDLSKFRRWERYEHKIFSLDSVFDDLLDLKTINVEFIDDNPIEVHLRSSEDPDYNELIPVWAGEEKRIDIYTSLGYKYIESKDDCDGFLNTPRIGFIVK
jgi:hypothetical protein